MRALPVPVLAVHDPCLAGMQRNPTCSILPPIASATASGLGVAGAVHHRIIDVALEGDARELPGHPHIERVVQEQVRDHG